MVTFLFSEVIFRKLSCSGINSSWNSLTWAQLSDKSCNLFQLSFHILLKIFLNHFDIIFDVFFDKSYFVSYLVDLLFDFVLGLVIFLDELFLHCLSKTFPLGPSFFLFPIYEKNSVDLIVSLPTHLYLELLVNIVLVVHLLSHRIGMHFCTVHYVFVIL